MSAGGQFEVLHSDVNSLRNNPISDLFVDNNSNGSGVDIEDGAGSSVIVFVGHAFVDGSINYNVDNVSIFVGGEGLGDVNGSVLFESLSEFVSGFALVTVAVGHLWLK